MVATLRKSVTVKKGGVIHIRSPKLRGGEKADVIVLVSAAKPKRKTKAGKKYSALDWLEKNAVNDPSLPRDWAHQHDHYLYGTPKKKD
ncbi:MAG: hypothetical protein HY291_06625 [Planctomycetes bacterium]|nr:hypothetical protein [Planctomycetota bacterium]